MKPATLHANGQHVIRMYYRDHGPPHFHAVYAGQEAVIDIETLQIRDGRLTRRALNLVLDWAELHKTELLDNWNLAAQRQGLKQIAPLE